MSGGQPDTRDAGRQPCAFKRAGLANDCGKDVVFDMSTPAIGGSGMQRVPTVALFIALFGLALVVGIWALACIQVRRDYSEATADEFTKIGNMAVAHEAHAVRLLQEADQLALLLKEQYEHPGPKADLKAWAAAGIIRPDTFSYVGVVDAAGSVIAVSVGAGPQSSRSLADREFFRFHMNDPADKLRIGEPVVGRTTGIAGIPMTRRINRPDGSFGGVADVVINVRALTTPFRDLTLGAKDILTLVRPDGIVLARRAGDKITFAENVSASNLMTRPRTEPVGQFLTPSAIDQRMRFVSYRRLKDYGLIAAVATDQETVLAPVRQRAAGYYAGAAVFSLFVLLSCGLMALALMRQKRTSHALNWSEARYRRLFETAQDGILLLNADTGQIEDVNPYLVEMLGYTHAEFLGKKLWEVGAFTHIGQNMEKFAELQKSGYVRYENLPLLTRNGKRIAVEFISNSYQSAGVKVIQCNIRDITERVETDRELREYKAIVDASDDAIISKSLDGIIKSWNPGAERMFGYSAAEAIGHSMTMIIPDDRLDEEPKILARLAAGEKVEHFETVRHRSDGTLIDISATVSPIRNQRHEVVGASKIARDITNSKLAEAAQRSLELQLRESQKMEAIGTLAGGIAHDFNNIIATILGNVALAHEDVPQANHLALQSLDEIRKAATRARDLVQQILSFSRRQPVERKRIALAEVIDESVRLLRATLPARLSIEVACEPGVADVMADYSLMQQVVINLATNAMQAMRVGPGRIRIRLDMVLLDVGAVQAHSALAGMYIRRPGRTVRLRLTDTGPGMDAATLARLFEPFFTTKPVGEGTGLGLSVVHGIARTHDGAILVESRLGEGATFSLYLPAADDPPKPSSRDLATPGAPLSVTGARGQHLLYIDDDEALVFLIKRLLERRGFRVSGYTDAAEALVALRADPAEFDLVVSDYNMPGMSGLDVARIVRTIRADLPVAVASGLIAEELRFQAREAGVRDLIFKATAVEELCDAFARLAQSLGDKPPSS